MGDTLIGLGLYDVGAPLDGLCDVGVCVTGAD